MQYQQADVIRHEPRTSGFTLFDFLPQESGSGITLPSFMARRSDFLIDGEKDGHAIFDSLTASYEGIALDRESNQRFYAYNHFGQHRSIGQLVRRVYALAIVRDR